MNFFVLDKCPKCGAGDMCGGGVAKIGADSSTCNRCGFKRLRGFLFCEICQISDSISKFTKLENSYLHHDSECRRKSINKTARKTKWFDRKVSITINYEVEKGKFVDYLTDITYEEVDALWLRKAWLEPDSIPAAANLDDDDIKELIEITRRVKYLNSK